MGTDRDKVMEVLLRRVEGGGSPSPAQPHLDADGIAAFAADALPQPIRRDYVSHLADCSRCRSMLVGAMTFEARPESGAVPATIRSSAGSWWRELVRMPVYSYAGILFILLFGGMVAFVVFRGNLTPVEVSEVRDVPAPARPEMISKQSDSSAATGVVPDQSQVNRTSRPSPEPEINKDSSVERPTPPSPAADERVSAEMEERLLRAASQVPKGITESPSAKMAAPAPASESAERTVTARGKNFSKRDGIWVDSEYRGGPVTYVRRDSDEFRTLDPELRALAGELPGPALIVWKAQAFRIQ